MLLMGVVLLGLLLIGEPVAFAIGLSGFVFFLTSDPAHTRGRRPVTRPPVLMTGAYPAWDLEEMAPRDRLLKLWEAPDQEAFVAAHAAEVRAIATCGDLGAAVAKRLAVGHLVTLAGLRHQPLAEGTWMCGNGMALP